MGLSSAVLLFLLCWGGEETLKFEVWTALALVCWFTSHGWSSVFSFLLCSVSVRTFFLLCLVLPSSHGGHYFFKCWWQITRFLLCFLELWIKILRGFVWMWPDWNHWRIVFESIHHGIILICNAPNMTNNFYTTQQILHFKFFVFYYIFNSFFITSRTYCWQWS